MDFKKLAPWNWFNKESEQDLHAVPVNRRHLMANRSSTIPDPVFDEIDHLFDTAFSGLSRSFFGRNLDLPDHR